MYKLCIFNIKKGLYNLVKFNLSTTKYNREFTISYFVLIKLKLITEILSLFTYF
jgi:hypothetical protein